MVFLFFGKMTGISATSSSSSQAPMGRDRAIETLMDRESRGSFYRAARVVEETVPSAFSSRPNLITKSALIEQAFALAEYDIDDQEKYLALVGSRRHDSGDGSKSTLTEKASSSAIDSVSKDRILRYQGRIASVKKRIHGNNEPSSDGAPEEGSNSKSSLRVSTSPSSSESASSSASPVPSGPVTASLVAALRKVYETDQDEGGSFDFKSLLQSVTAHSALQEASGKGVPPSWEAHLEEILQQVCVKQDLRGLNIAILSILVRETQELTEQVGLGGKKSQLRAQAKDEEDDKMPSLQVAALLSLLNLPSDNSESPRVQSSFCLDPAWLDYFGQAAAVYEERLEIQKARLLARMPSPVSSSSKPKTRATSVSSASSHSSASSGAESPPSLLQRRSVDTVTANSSQEGSQADLVASVLEATTTTINSSGEEILAAAAAAEALSAAFEQVLSGTYDGSNVRSALYGEEGSEDGEEEEEEEDISDSDEDSDDDSDVGDEDGPQAEPDQNADDEEGEDDSSDSSSSSSAPADADAVAESDRPLESERGIDETSEDEDDSALRQALNLSLAATERDGVGADTTESSTAQVVTDHDDTSAAAADGLLETIAVVSERSTSDPASSEAKEDASLPLLPNPPQLSGSDPLRALLGLPPDESPSERGLSKSEQPVLDPASVVHFGSLPTSCVLVHLLRSAAALTEKDSGVTAKKVPSEPRSSVVREGMGSSLFGPLEAKDESSESDSSIDLGSSADLSLQLCIAIVFLLLEKRDDAIEKLRNAVVREQQVARGDELKQAHEDEQDHPGAPLPSGEEDDPALTLAMNYVEDDVPLSSESLENKGMRRKAAAAAHDAETMLRSLRVRTQCWKEKVELYSVSTLYALKILRMYLQGVVLRSLRSGSTLASISGAVPSSTSSRLSSLLGSLMSLTSQSLRLSVIVGEETQKEQVFRSIDLYQEAVSTWGECIPLFYPSARAQKGALCSLLDDCSLSKITGPVPYVRSFDSLNSFPLSELETKLHKLQMLCRRLRVGDLLVKFVSRPIPRRGADVGREKSETGETVLAEPEQASSLVSILAGAVDDVAGARTDVQRLYLAICHRFHSQILLFDGLYSLSESEFEGRSSAMTAAKALTTGDIVRVNFGPSSQLQFDSTKCSDSIAMLPGSGGSSVNGPSVHQRASKVWGCVLATQHFNPKSGVHRWAVRLDKCERGHVFVGVSTSQASMKTYVGGDKYGWGMIGTQALWHDRRKIRGDYGATFRTGSTIIVTLDTDAGTLSFSSWKDATSSSSFSLDSSTQPMASPRRHAQVGGTVEDWGVAFEGLPLDSRLYPAVGLYQRDDRVTILSVDSGSYGSICSVDGECYFPGYGKTEEDYEVQEVTQIRQFNSLLLWDGIQYSVEVLRRIPEVIAENPDDFHTMSLFHSLAATLCLIPRSVPVLSTRLAITLMPHLSRCILKLDRLRKNKSTNQGLFRSFPADGRWAIRATGVSGKPSDFEEYIVEFKPAADEKGVVIGFEGNGVGTTGKSKNGLVTILGCSKGSSLTFVEEWSGASEEDFGSPKSDDTSSCVVSARMSLDENTFEGVYRNVHYGTSGQIVGKRIEESRRVILKRQESDFDAVLTLFQHLLCLAFGHIATCGGEDIIGTDDLKSGNRLVKDVISETFLSSLSLPASLSSLELELGAIEDFCWPNTVSTDLQCLEWEETCKQMDHAVVESKAVSFDISAHLDLVKELDVKLAGKFGGEGSMSCLCRDSYKLARFHIICVLVHVCGSVDLFDIDADSDVDRSPLSEVWRGALQIVENETRRALAHAQESSKRKTCERVCALICRVSSFILCLERDHGFSRTVPETIEELSEVFKVIKDEDAVDSLQAEMRFSSRIALIRLISLTSVERLLSPSGVECPFAIEALSVCLPRLLGRGQGNSNGRDGLNANKAFPSLDGTYLTGLGGASLSLRRSLSRIVADLYKDLGQVLRRTLSEREDLSIHRERRIGLDSLILSLLAVFSTNTVKADIRCLVDSSAIVQHVAKACSIYRTDGLEDISLAAYECGEDDVIQITSRICQRDLSRSLLRCSAAVAHVILYQCAAVAQDTKLAKDCIEGMRLELETLFSILENEGAEQFAISGRKLLKEEIIRWASPGSSETLDSSLFDRTGKVRGLAAIRYLKEYGTSPGTLERNTSTKQARTKSSAGTNPNQSSKKGKLEFRHHYLSHWLHILCSALHLPVSNAFMVADRRWLELLLSTAGLSLVGQGDVSFKNFELRGPDHLLVPARFRSRVIRLILPLIRSLEPSLSLAEGLILLAGYTSNTVSKSWEDHTGFVSRETVSLLRHLHCPGLPGWRNCINSALASTLKGDERDGRSLWSRIGALAFFSMDILPLQQGSYVLLKPPAAVSLSQEHQAAMGSKAHSSGVGGSTATSGSTPHHIAGNGTESVVAGLCRREAPAGIVSNIDLKNGVCEVILVARDDEDADGLRSVSKSRNSLGGRHTLTVRALRTPLADVVLAQEAPLFLDESIPVKELVSKMLLESASAVLSSVPCVITPDGQREDGETEAMDEVLLLTCNLMILRACTVLLSDEQIASVFVGAASSMSILKKVLSLAWPEEGNIRTLLGSPGKMFLSSLPVHEARLGYLVDMLRDLRFRSGVMTKTTDVDLDKEVTTCLDLVKQHSLPPATDAEVPLTENTATSGASASVWSSAREVDSHSNRTASQSAGGSNSDEDDEESEEAATAAAHLREAAIAQMAELGLPRSWSELALRRTGGTNIEAAVTFCLERGGEMERLLSEERERERMAQHGSSTRRRQLRDSTTNHLLRQLQDMGFPARWCAEALAVTGNDVDEALTWILTNGERLSEEDEALEAEADSGVVNEDDDSGEEEDEDEEVGAQVQKSETAPEKPDTDETAWTGSITPLRFISGRGNINTKTLEVSGLPTGGFSSVGTKGVLLTSGKWYYEAILQTAGCLQIGWADGSFAGHCNSDRGDGCGDGPSSWAYDGWRRYRWHSTATEWGCRWKEGDVVGCLVDLDSRVISFTLNGKAEEVGMGVAFSGEGFRPVGGVYACASFNRREKLKFILGGRGSESFRFSPPEGFKGVGEAVLDATAELANVLAKESIPDLAPSSSCYSAKFLCDFSDGEHGHELMAWAHRYYGSDASVHLGSGRPKTSAGSSSKMSTSSSYDKDTVSLFLSKRLERVWRELNADSKEEHEHSPGARSMILKGYSEVQKVAMDQLVTEALTMSVLTARKLVLHLMISMGGSFDPSWIVSDSTEEFRWMLLFWKVVEASSSLRSVGWVGEAGAMAVAAEALGLGISSQDHVHSRSNPDRIGVSPASDLDEGLFLPTAGITQLLSCVLVSRGAATAVATDTLLAAAAEAAVGSDSGGGLLYFLRESIQGVAIRSKAFRQILVANIRRSIRLLAVVEYDNEPDNESSEVEEGSEQAISEAEKEEIDESHQSTTNPDARLVSFLSGLLLSKQVETSSGDFSLIQQELAEAWSIGLLSASLPWRMICGYTVAGLINLQPEAFPCVVGYTPTLARYFARLPCTVARRIWAERAAHPVCSRYAQAMVELLSAVRRAVPLLSKDEHNFRTLWTASSGAVDAATPLPVRPSLTEEAATWESEDGWVSTDSAWEVWTGRVEYIRVDWKAPSRSGVRTLMDAGQGPPMLGEGCFVVRGADWDQGENGNEDGNDSYESQKANRENEKKDAERAGAQEEPHGDPINLESPKDGASAADNNNSEDRPEEAVNPAEHGVSSLPLVQEDTAESKKQRKKRIPSPKLPLGTVVSVESWDGVQGAARRVKWHRTGEEKIYRFGGDGGRYDICHVEVNDKHTRIKKKHPVPESAEQCAARHGFGAKKAFNVLLRLLPAREEENSDIDQCREGVMEWPDFGAGVRVSCTLHGDGAVTIEEKELVYGSKDSGWEPRFGQPSFVSGSVVTLSATRMSSAENQASLDAKSASLSMYQELLGSTSFAVSSLRNTADGSKLRIASEYRLFRSLREGNATKRQPRCPPPLITFDSDCHAPSISLSHDGRTASCVASEGRGTAFASVGFTKGVHYWEVKLEQADIGSVFIGVAEKPSGSGSGSSFGYDTPPRLNRWHGWGFVNFRATFTSGAERVYGAHCHAGDTVGVLLDCDAGRVSFFFDGLKYGEHILNDLGCAFENLSPFGFNVDGCGNGGVGQGAPNGFESSRSGRYPSQGNVRPRTLYPVIGLRNHGDRVTMSSKWNTSYGVDGVSTLRNILATDEIMHALNKSDRSHEETLPTWYIREAFVEYKRWYDGRMTRSSTRGSGPFTFGSFGLDVDLDCSPIACAAASAGLGLPQALLSGDRVRLTRSAGRILELAEEAVVLGAYQGRLYYRIVSQKSEGGSLTEGGGRAWFWDESEVVDGLPFVNPGKGKGVSLAKPDRYKCLSSGGLKIVFEGGAVLRSDLEIFDGSSNLGTIPVDTIIPKADVLERRVNSCGVVRYKVRYGDLGEGWISARIRGGKEDLIVECVDDETIDVSLDDSFRSPEECAEKWHEDWVKAAKEDSEIGDDLKGLNIQSYEVFEKLIGQAKIPGLSSVDSDSLLTSALNAVSNFSGGDNTVEVPFRDVAAALSFVLAKSSNDKIISGASPATVQAAASVFSELRSSLPPLRALLARIALIKAFNRRARLALPWLSLRPCQEGSGMFGGLTGYGTSIERAGRSRALGTNEWVSVPSIATTIRRLRGLFFTSVKRELLSSITEATTTPTPLSHDEYELPREIRTVRLNRLKAARALASDDTATMRKYGVFAQLHSETRSWGGAALRRGYVAKGHGGQKRAFKVKLIGEGVNDYSGPYREVFTDAIGELIKADANGRGALGVLDPTPNNASSIGENRDLFMFSLNGREVSTLVGGDASSTLASEESSSKEGPLMTNAEAAIRNSFGSLTTNARDEATRDVEEALVFLGRITGTAYRHGIPVDLPLPLGTVWKALTEEAVSIPDQLEELDYLARRQLTETQTKQGSQSTPPLLRWQQRMLNSFVEGLSNVVPVEVLPLLTGEELRDTLCGNPEVDVDLLQSVVEYEGYEPTVEEDATVLDFFWQTLREIRNDERKQFLQFVWARNRLPLRASDFEAPFKIQKDTLNVGDRADQALPSASTCFFTLTLPAYSHQEILKEKLLFAINNVTTMETDFQTNSAEIAEGYRAL